MNGAVKPKAIKPPRYSGDEMLNLGLEHFN
jgi:hypothetical protein